MTQTLPKTRFLDIGETSLQYLVYPGDGHTIILLHATGFLPWLWHPIARYLNGVDPSNPSSLSHRVIAPYFCDHREPTPGGTEWVTLAADLAALCKGLNIQNPIFVGHSMGATVMTITQAIHQVGAKGMVLIEPIFFPKDYYIVADRMAHPLVEKSLRRRNQWENQGEVMAYLKSKPLFANWDDEFLSLYVQHGTVQRQSFNLELTCPPQREADLFMGSLGVDPWPLLSKIECPVLVVEGAKSGNREFIDLKKAASCFKQGKYVCIEGAGHLVPMEKPHDTLNAVCDFISTC